MVGAGATWLIVVWSPSFPKRCGAAEHQAAADDGDDQELGDPEGEEAGATHESRYSPASINAT